MRREDALTILNEIYRDCAKIFPCGIHDVYFDLVQSEDRPHRVKDGVLAAVCGPLVNSEIPPLFPKGSVSKTGEKYLLWIDKKSGI